MAGEDFDYVRFVKTLRCRMWMHDPCEPMHGVDPHHAGQRGLGQKAHDHTSIPLCRKHHRALHDLAPPFRTMPKTVRRRWVDDQIDWVRARWADCLRSQVTR